MYGVHKKRKKKKKEKKKSNIWTFYIDLDLNIVDKIWCSNLSILHSL